MKDSKEYSEKIQKLYRLLKRKYQKPREIMYDDPVDALVYAIISENMSETAAQSTIKRFEDHFVDINDLRVSLVEEIVEVLKTDTPVTRDIALTLTKALGTIFDGYNSVSLAVLKKMGKRPARQALEEIEGTSPFIVSYCMLTSLQAHAIPLTGRMVEYLESNQMVHPDADEQEIEGFLARQISASNAYEFYALLRRESESRRDKQNKKKKTTHGTKTKTRTAKTKRSKK